MMLMLIVMIMMVTFTSSLSHPDSLWFKRSKSGCIGILFRQLDEYHNHSLRIDLNLAATRKHILL
jgi:hypothetical protein